MTVQSETITDIIATHLTPERDPKRDWDQYILMGAGLLAPLLILVGLFSDSELGRAAIITGGLLIIGLGLFRLAGSVAGSNQLKAVELALKQLKAQREH